VSAVIERRPFKMSVIRPKARRSLAPNGWRSGARRELALRSRPGCAIEAISLLLQKERGGHARPRHCEQRSDEAIQAPLWIATGADAPSR
jgi:hypothetical protein